MPDLFDTGPSVPPRPAGEPRRDGEPLASRMRPRTLDEIAGQQHILGQGKLLRRAIEADRFASLIFYGPPGTGKTTLASVIARTTGSRFESLNGVESNVAEIRAKIDQARTWRDLRGETTILFIDEIHRFNKAQQDVILPYAEDGTVTLIGATTENPSFEVVAPLLSRVRVIRLTSLADDDLAEIVDAAIADPDRGLGRMHLAIEPEARQLLVEGANGDARAALTALEIAGQMAAGLASPITQEHVKQALQDRRPYYDKQADFHYDTVSAFIKSLRGSDPDGALYWLARMLESGEDPLFVMRRMVILAAEDVSLADPHALPLAVATQQAVHFIGMPEGWIPMAECCVYLALAPKSNSTYLAYQKAKEDALRTSHLPVPMHLRNAVTGMMRQFGYGQGYRYAHSEADHFARGATYLPEQLGNPTYYTPGTIGAEAALAARLATLRELPGLPEEPR